MICVMVDAGVPLSLGSLFSCGAEFRDTCGVYTIGAPSGKFYVGMTSQSFYARWKQHRSLLCRGRHHCVGLQRAFWKYGAGGLSLGVVCSFPVGEVSVEELGVKEIEVWDSLTDSGVLLYNARPLENEYVIHGVEASARRRRSATGAKRRKWGVLSTTPQVCSGCGAQFMNKQRRKYCSHGCFVEHRMRGQEETRDRIIRCLTEG